MLIIEMIIKFIIGLLLMASIVGIGLFVIYSINNFLGKWAIWEKIKDFIGNAFAVSVLALILVCMSVTVYQIGDYIIKIAN